MTRRILTAAHTTAVAAIAMTVAWIAALTTNNSTVTIAAGVTAAWLAQAFLPCPCHRKGHRP
jgi:uncharacterized protein (DUF486 family)